MSNLGVISRDIWTHGGGWPLPDLLRSALSSLLLHRQTFPHIYFASPWITDFDLFDNRFKAYEGIYPAFPPPRKLNFQTILLSFLSFVKSGFYLQIINIQMVSFPMRKCAAYPISRRGMATKNFTKRE